MKKKFLTETWRNCDNIAAFIQCFVTWSSRKDKKVTVIYFKFNDLLWIQWKLIKKIILPFMIFSSNSFCCSSGLIRNFFIFCHGSRPAPEGSASSGPLGREDRVPRDRLMTSFAKTATKTALSLSHFLRSCAINTGPATSSSSPSFLPVSPTS